MPPEEDILETQADDTATSETLINTDTNTETPANTSRTKKRRSTESTQFLQCLAKSQESLQSLVNVRLNQTSNQNDNKKDTASHDDLLSKEIALYLQECPETFAKRMFRTHLLQQVVTFHETQKLPTTPAVPTYSTYQQGNPLSVPVHHVQDHTTSISAYNQSLVGSYNSPMMYQTSPFFQMSPFCQSLRTSTSTTLHEEPHNSQKTDTLASPPGDSNAPENEQQYFQL